MKKLILTLFTLTLIHSSAYAAEIYLVDAETANIGWVGTKVAGQHNGQIKLESGHIVIQAGKWMGGEAVIDMTSITVEDIEDPKYNKKLVDHLKNADFFDVEKHKKAVITIEEVSPKGKDEFDVLADVTIKGITKPINFTAKLMKHDGGYSAEALITFDRTQFDVKYGSGKFFQNLGDKLIHDEFSLTVQLNAAKQVSE